MDAVAALMFLGVFTLTLLPLVVILPSSPPMTDPDDAPGMPLYGAHSQIWRVGRGNWHLSISFTRQETK